ncbi:MAG: MauE/DoxX family redox-associated membrane protein [Opitutaceae bacterium]|jgi:uncharacterized membrane protein YphA (DoxX/SURF4 family)
MKFSDSPVVAWLAVRLPQGVAWVIAVVLGWAGVVKAADPHAFTKAIENFRLVEGAAAGVLAYYVPWLEIVVAVGLLFTRWRKAAAYVALLLLIAFTVLLASAQWRGLNVACGCFGASDKMQTTAFGWLYLRNGLLVAGAYFLIKSTRIEP